MCISIWKLHTVNVSATIFQNLWKSLSKSEKSTWPGSPARFTIVLNYACVLDNSCDDNDVIVTSLPVSLILALSMCTECFLRWLWRHSDINVTTFCSFIVRPWKTVSLKVACVIVIATRPFYQNWMQWFIVYYRCIGIL